MKSKHFYLFYLFLLITIIFSTSVLAQELPLGLQKIIEYNKEQAQFYFENITFFIAFLAGVLSLFLPCTIAVLPAFFTYTFKEKKEITKMTLMFFFGFTTIFIIFGVLAAFIGKSINALQMDNNYLVLIAGIILVVFGIMVISGKGFSFINIKKKVNNDKFGVFLTGILFGVGWSACLGPIISGVLLMATVLQNYFNAVLLLFSYSLGLFVPLFIISFLFDKYNISSFVNKLNKRIKFSIANLIAGILLIFIGLIFIFFKGTSVINNLSIFGNSIIAIYKLQENLLSAKFINIIGLIILIVFLFLLFKFIKGSRKTVI